MCTHLQTLLFSTARLCALYRIKKKHFMYQTTLIFVEREFPHTFIKIHSYQRVRSMKHNFCVRHDSRAEWSRSSSRSYDIFLQPSHHWLQCLIPVLNRFKRLSFGQNRFIEIWSFRFRNFAQHSFTEVAQLVWRSLTL